MIILGLGTTINNRLSSAGFSAEYQAILTAGSGFTRPNATEQALQNQLIIDLKSAGIWAKLDAFYMFANNITDSTGAFARINWKNPTANYGTAGASGLLPTILPKAGFTGNGINQSVNLNFKPSVDGVNFANPNASFGVKLGIATTLQDNTIMGAGQTTNRMRNTASGQPSRAMQIQTNSLDGRTFLDNDFVYLNRFSGLGADTALFANGVKVASGYPGTWTAETNFFHILNFGNVNVYGNSQIKLAFIGGDLSTGTIPSTFNTLISTYITAVNNLV